MTEDEIIAQATKLINKGIRMTERGEDLLQPLWKDCFDASKERIDAMLLKLPRGFFRAELRAHRYRTYGKD